MAEDRDTTGRLFRLFRVGTEVDLAECAQIVGDPHFRSDLFQLLRTDAGKLVVLVQVLFAAQSRLLSDAVRGPIGCRVVDIAVVRRVRATGGARQGQGVRLRHQALLRPGGGPIQGAGPVERSF